VACVRSALVCLCLIVAGVTALALDAPQPRGLTTVELQVALDRRGFGVGLIDNKSGSKTRAALADFKKSRGLNGDDGLAEALGVKKCSALKTYVVTRQDVEKIGLAPADWVAAAAVPAMAAETLAEVLSEKFHASEDYLLRLNSELSGWGTNAVGKTVTVPNVTGAADLSDAARIVIDCRQFRLRAMDATGRIVASFPCSVAADLSRVPTGSLSLAASAANPIYVFDPKNYPESPRAQEIGRKLIIPAGPNCPVGEYWLGLNKPGFGIHGTPHPDTIGRQESHGCFRLTNWDIVRLSKIIKFGTPVEVTGLGDKT
jgi:lipoprotein-anchoring transpeptidase ErfK/SrfK